MINSLAFKGEGRRDKGAEGREYLPITASANMPREINALTETYSFLSWHHGAVIFKDESAHSRVSAGQEMP